jgi:hypothetical protein
MKRKAGGDGSVTGGTGDYHPQLMRAWGVTSAADTFTLVTLQVPRPNVIGNSSKVVMEILRVKHFRPVPLSNLTLCGCAILSGTPNLTDPGNYLSTQANDTKLKKLFTDPRTISTDQFYFGNVNNTVQGNGEIELEHDDDRSDARGFGYLYPGDNLYWYIDTAGLGSVGAFGIEILYRWKRVGVNEYLGMVTNLLNN